MSLNWREIDLVLEELSLPGAHIQQVVQPDFRNLYLQIYRPGDVFWLRICLETGKTRLHRTEHGVSKPKKRQRFSQLLHSRIRGGRITRAEQIDGERIVRLEVERAGESTLIWIRLWGGAANVVITDRSGTILDAFFRRPKRKEVSGEHFELPQSASPGAGGVEERSGKKARFEPRFDPAQGSVCRQVEDFYHAREVDEQRTELQRAATRMLSRSRNSTEQRLAQVRERLAESESADRLQLFGDLVISNLHRIPDGARWFSANDYTRDTETTIELDPSLSAQENAERYYNRARKARKRREVHEEEARNLTKRLQEVEAQLEQLDTLDLDDLRRIVQHAEATSGRKTKHPNDDWSTPGLRFESNGFAILVGRNVRENDELLRRHVRGNDLWLHTRDYPGGYVFVKTQLGKSVPLEVLLDAGNLAVYYSKARPNGKAELYYTQVKYLRRAKDGPAGLVLPTQEKNLSIALDHDRLTRLRGVEEPTEH